MLHIHIGNPILNAPYSSIRQNICMLRMCASYRMLPLFHVYPGWEMLQLMQKGIANAMSLQMQYLA